MQLEIGICALIFATSQAFIFGESGKWDTLKVTWDVNPLNGFAFNEMPRTISEATHAGFRKDASCSTSRPFRGNRYLKDGDDAVMLLYDKNGFIAGIQVGIPKNSPRHYPMPVLRPPWVDDGDKYILTAYFVNPSTICSHGRTSAEYNAEGTGNGLFLQNGTSPDEHLVIIPHLESDMSHTKWVKGKCFKTMGVHYWYNTHENMSCDEFEPVFILYNKGKLNAFGWAITANIQPSRRYEHPPSATFGLFMNPAPTCLSHIGTISTMHIFLSGNPVLNDWC